jgi:predicted Ser/Thr protein kinase
MSNITSLQRSQVPFSTLKIEKEIGEGSYGKLYLGKWNAAPVALKFCKQKDKMEDFMREIQLMMYV